MKQLMVNLIAIVVIGIGSLTLIEPQPVQAKNNTITSQNDATLLAECTEDGKTVSGNRCAIINGHCTCWDV